MLVLLPLLAVALTILWTFFHHLRDPKRLRRFPSPSIAAYTPLWSMYHSWIGDQYLAIHAAHQRLGSVVRIAPNHISFVDHAAYKEIYGYGTSVLKDQFYANVADGNPSMAQAVDKETHGAKRKNLAHVFSAKEIVAMEPRIIEVTKKLCRALIVKAQGGRGGSEDGHEVVDGVFDLRPWLNMLTYDAISSMFFTQGYAFLEQGNDLCLSEDAEGRIKEVHAMDSFHSAGRFNTALGQLTYPLYKLGRRLLWFVHGNESGSDFVGMARYMVHSRMSKEPKEPDLFSCLPVKPSEKRPVPMTVNEIVAECTTMLDAGSDTTQTTLASCVYHLAAYPEIQEKLHRELSNVVSKEPSTGVKVPGTEALQRVPYLRAVLEENWRCRPPVARGLPRRVVGDGADIAGHFIPSDTTVSASIYSLHRDETLFPDPLRFLPERWLPNDGQDGDDREKANLKKYCIAFSLGPRACIGRNLAYMEVSIVVAALVLNFKWELAEEGKEMPMVERFNCNPKELMVKARVRQNLEAQ